MKIVIYDRESQEFRTFISNLKLDSPEREDAINRYIEENGTQISAKEYWDNRYKYTGGYSKMRARFYGEPTTPLEMIINYVGDYSTYIYIKHSFPGDINEDEINWYSLQCHCEEMSSLIEQIADNLVEDKVENNINNTPEMVDLGLPSGNLWAKCNIGAKTETEAGKYFAWGDAEGFEASKVSGSMFSNTWYATRPGASLTGNISGTDAAHNAAFTAYGVGYTMPSREDFKELIDCTINEWTTVGNVDGWKFTNKNDVFKCIFIPAAGCGYSGSISNVDYRGCYWGSSFHNSNYAYNLFFLTDYINIYYYNRCCGYPVRAIKKK